MRKKKKKTNVGKTILFIILFVVAMVAAFFGAKKIMELIKKPDTPVVTNTMKFEVNSYNVYFDENKELGFNFVLCEVKVSDEQPFTLDLDKLITNEDKMLSNFSEYITKLTAKGYDIGFTMADEYVAKNSNSTTIKLFIPFEKSEDIKVYMNGEKVFGFSHKSHNENIITLKSDANIKEEGYALKVSSAYAINKSMYQNGTEYEVSSSARIYVFKIEVISAEKAVKITDAKFISDSLHETINVLNASFTSDKYNNIYDVYLNAGDVGYLFFEVYVGNEETKPNYDGKLQIKLSALEKWVELSTNFN